MSQSRIQIKVGLFVFLGLAMLGGLTLLFSRSNTFLKDYYELRLRSGNVGGIKSGAKVLMRGVQVGTVKGTRLNDGGRDVTIYLRIESGYKLFSDARFEIEQAGFLGDQFIAIYPTDDLGYTLTNHADVVAKPPFNMQEAVAVATEMIVKISQTTTNLNAAVSDVRRLVLTEQKLESLGASLDRLNAMTVAAESAVRGLSAIVTNNAQPVSSAVSNLNLFASQLPPLADYVKGVVRQNETNLNTAMHNLETSTATITNLLADLEAGRGAAGRFLRDEKLASDLSAIANNLSTTTSNLNTRGLWGIMWKQKTPPAAATNAPARK